jgi:hypothetical protein
VEEDAEEEDIEEQEEEEQEEHRDLLASRPCGLVGLTPTWVGSSSAQQTIPNGHLNSSLPPPPAAAVAVESRRRKRRRRRWISTIAYVCIGDDGEPACSS